MPTGGWRRLAPVAATLALAAAGGLAAAGVGLPAPALLGSMLAVAAAALLRARVRVPGRLRDPAFAVIGCSLGSAITPDFLTDAARWPLSLALLCGMLAALIVGSSWLLARAFGIDRASAILATSPGALSYSLALTVSGVGDARVVATIQSLRLLAITLMLPLILDVAGARGTFWGEVAPAEMEMARALAVWAGAVALGWVGGRLGLPAAYLLAGMAVSGGTHAAGLVAGQFPLPLLTLGFVITGAVVGARFAGIARRDLRALAWAALSVVGFASALSAGFAALTAWLLAIPFGQAWVAYAPGGVEAMAAMALALGYDPTFVATHHVFRIVLLILTLPLFLRWLAR
ncbi:hypothetical protein AY600_02220 [Phormidium willei BDU 130791]|nr:hypothetical protein AY600_02220 [Phormidium willei BDU 130791]